MCIQHKHIQAVVDAVVGRCFMAAQLCKQQHPHLVICTSLSVYEQAAVGHSIALWLIYCLFSMSCWSHPGRREGASSSPPVSPRSACSTPGRTADSLRPAFRRCLPSRQYSSNDRQRFSQDSKRPATFTGNPWSTSGYSQGASSAYSSSSSCSIVRAIASLGLDGPRVPKDAKAAAAEALASAGRRGSISKAKKILAEAISSVPGAHGLASCASSAADTGVLSPLLTIIRNNGAVKSAADSSGRSSKSVSRRSSFSEVITGLTNRSSLDGSGGSSNSSNKERRVLRRSSFSEAAGGLNSDFEGDPEDAGTVSTSSNPTSRSSSLSSPQQLPVSPNTVLSPAQQQQKVVDCLETVRYLAMDDSNRMALIDLGAVELLLNKLQPTPASMFHNQAKSTSSSICSAPPVMEALLSALSVLAKHDATKLRVWDNPGAAALLALLSTRHTSPVVKAAHLCVANLAWSADLDRSCHASSGSSSVFDSVSSHHGRDDATSTASSGCGSNVLLTPALIPALAAGLHPTAEVPVLLSLLKLLNKAASSSCLAPSPASSPCSSSCPSESSNEQLCAVSLSPTHSSAWKVGWQQAIFALPPLLLRAAPSHSSCPGRQQLVLGAALELMIALTEQHPEFHAVICAAGCLPPLLALLVNGSSSQREHSLQAACVLHALLDCPDAVQLLGREGSLALLLQVLGDSHNSVDVRMAMLHILRRLAAASHSCVELLKLQGAVPVVVALLQQIQGNNEVKRTAVGLLQLLGKQVVVRPRKSQHSSACPSDSQRSSFESTCSAVSYQTGQPGAVEAAMQSLEKLALQQEQEHARSRGQHRLAQQQPYYLHAH